MIGADLQSVSYIGVFLEGLMSFLSPCILPLIPLYMSYLSSGAKDVDENGEVVYRPLKVFLTTICFTLGISTTFFIMGLSLSLVRDFIADYQNIIGLIGGIILILFALNQFGIINVSFLNREHRLEAKGDNSKMNYLKAYGLGFVFSFAWTPCVGPMLANVVILAATSEPVVGNLMIVLYTLGFTIPFLILGLFFEKALAFIKAKKGLLIKISQFAAVIILAFGLNMVYASSRNIIKIERDYKELLANQNVAVEPETPIETKEPVESEDTVEPTEQTEEKIPMMYDFELTDQFGNVHRLSDHQGKYVVLNFVSSWCTYCKKEVPDFKEYVAQGGDDVVYYYVMSDEINAQRNGSTTDEFVEEYNIDIPVLKDNGQMFAYLGVSSFPNIYYIGPDGSVIGYQAGAMGLDGMIEVEGIARNLYEER